MGTARIPSVQVNSSLYYSTTQNCKISYKMQILYLHYFLQSSQQHWLIFSVNGVDQQIINHPIRMPPIRCTSGQVPICLSKTGRRAANLCHWRRLALCKQNTPILTTHHVLQFSESRLSLVHPIPPQQMPYTLWALVEFLDHTILKHFHKNHPQIQPGLIIYTAFAQNSSPTAYVIQGSEANFYLSRLIILLPSVSLGSV